MRWGWQIWANSLNKTGVLNYTESRNNQNNHTFKLYLDKDCSLLPSYIKARYWLTNHNWSDGTVAELIALCLSDCIYKIDSVNLKKWKCRWVSAGKKVGLFPSKTPPSYIFLTLQNLNYELCIAVPWLRMSHNWKFLTVHSCAMTQNESQFEFQAVHCCAMSHSDSYWVLHCMSHSAELPSALPSSPDSSLAEKSPSR